MSAFRALPKLNNAAAFRAWLFRIARDRVYREFRRRQLPLSSLDSAADGEIIGAVNEEPLPAETIRSGLERLSPDHREVLMLRFMEEMSYEEIARITGSAPGTVRSRIHYAKRALKQALQTEKAP